MERKKMKLDQLTTNPETVIELLKDNPKALQFLHRQCAFDFCKPFGVVQTFGAFTLNSVKKAINAEKLDNLNIYMLLKCFDRCGSPERNLRAVEVNRSRIIGAQFGDLCGRWYDFNIDYFFGVGDFENVRKKQTEYTYIIYQNAEYKHEPKRNPDETYTYDTEKRYKLIEARPVCYQNGAKRLQEITIQDKESNAPAFKFKFAFVPAAPYTEAGEIIDKSGYIIVNRRADLKRRAEARRAERAKAEYLKQDFTEENAKTREELNSVARRAGELLAVGEGENDFNRIEKCVRYIRAAAERIEEHEKKTVAKSFASVEAFSKSLAEIRKNIEIASEFLTLVQPSNIHALAVQVLPPEDIDHHESDLYIRYSTNASNLVSRLDCKSLLSMFRSDGNLWYELPFCYSPAIGQKFNGGENNA